jgi:hypothetical protein
MASNRSRTRQRSAAHAAPAEPSPKLKALARRACAHPDRRLRCSSGDDIHGWAAAGRLAQTLGELIAFPRAAADHFDTRVARVSTDN